jgi:hypothetical protein
MKFDEVFEIYIFSEVIGIWLYGPKNNKCREYLSDLKIFIGFLPFNFAFNRNLGRNGLFWNVLK